MHSFLIHSRFLVAVGDTVSYSDCTLHTVHGWQLISDVLRNFDVLLLQAVHFSVPSTGQFNPVAPVPSVHVHLKSLQTRLFVADGATNSLVPASHVEYRAHELPVNAFRSWYCPMAHTLHTRLVVGDGSTIVFIPAAHVEGMAHVRSNVVLGTVVVYSELLHTVQAWHVLSFTFITNSPIQLLHFFTKKKKKK